MIEHLKEVVNQALLDLRKDGYVPDDLSVDIDVERTRSPEHGDYATNVAMRLAKPLGKPPREIAERIIAELPPSAAVDSVEIAGPGFINFRLTETSHQQVVKRILNAGEAFGPPRAETPLDVSVEFVSANPTGPLHVGHGRGAAYGSSLANVLAAVGHDVQREYYVNDKGRQMDILGLSVWLRYLELCGQSVQFPDGAYQGDYVVDIARAVREANGDELRMSPAELTADIAAPANEKGETDRYLDQLITRARELIGDGFEVCRAAALKSILADIEADLEAFGVDYDEWFSERSLADSGALEKAVADLEASGHTYRQDGALWFRSTHFEDDKDRVVVRDNGAPTYFASDLAYLHSKLQRFGLAIYVLGADHYGYIARLRAAAEALGYDKSRVEIAIVQFANLYRGDQKVAMSTRSGEFVTLRELREEVGTDAARFFYVLRSHEQHLDFDLELAKAQSADNPVYYVQYAHARVCSVFAQLGERGFTHNSEIGNANLDRLTEPQEVALLQALSDYPQMVELASRKRAPHHVAHYLRDLANHFHTWYNACQFIVDEVELRNARLNLADATRQVIANALRLLGVSAPESM